MICLLFLFYKVCLFKLCLLDSLSFLNIFFSIYYLEFVSILD